MMISDLIRIVAKQLDLEPNSKRLNILFALAEIGRPLTVGEIATLPTIRCDTAGRRAALYKTIAKLKSEGAVERLQETGKVRYFTNERLIRTMIARQQSSKIEHLKQQILNLVASKKFLESLTQYDFEKIGRFLMDKGAKKKYSTVHDFSRGADRFTKSLHEHIMKRIRKGDIIRISVAWGKRGFFTDDGITMKMIERTINRGAIVKVLGPDRSQINQKNLDITRKLYQELREASKDIEIRLRSQTKKTYEGFLKNRDIGILIISYNPEPMVQLIPYETNVELLEDIVATFDNEFAKAIPLY